MIFPIFASVVLFCIFLAFAIKRTNRKEQSQNELFWEKEAEANQTRKKSLDDLRFIVIPEERTALFGDVEEIPPTVNESVNCIAFLKEAKIVNFNNISNTDLKLMYGAANLALLTEYDQNYTSLIRSLQIYGEYFISQNDFEHALLVLEYAVATGCDSISIYKMLCDIYRAQQDSSKMNYLLSTASLLPGITKGPILRYLTQNAPKDTPDEESILDILD